MEYCLSMILAGCAFLSDAPKESALEKEVKRLAIPDRLVPKGKKPLLILRADGVQIYKANAKLAWEFQAPKATLRDYRTGEVAGRHMKGPIWQNDKGSKLIADKVATELAPNPEAIPWLLLEVTNITGGQFAKVSHIQRVDTWAGLQPTAGPTQIEQIIEVPYHATYIFWGDR